MSTESKICFPNLEDLIKQGDVFEKVKYNYIDDERGENVTIIEYEFPLAIVISQACDVIYASDLISNKEGAFTKFMPSVLMCPIYYDSMVRDSQHIINVINEFKIKPKDGNAKRMYSTKEFDLAKEDYHYRYHVLNIENEGKMILEKSIIDFKHYFCVPISYLLNNRKNRLYRLDDIFSEQITLKFSNFLSRVGIPS